MGLVVSGVALLTPVAVTAETQDKQVVMIVVNRMTVNDLRLNDADYPNLSRWIREGGIGMMNINTAGGNKDYNAYMTLGAGSKAVGSTFAGMAFNTDEAVEEAGLPAGETGGRIYERNTGRKAVDGQVVNIAVAGMPDNREQANASFVAGNLGQILKEAGMKTAVIGNADIPGKPAHRLGALIAMDRSGRVDMGDVSRNLLASDPLAPFGVRTDYDKLLGALQKVRSADFIVIETGDLDRLEAYRDQMLPSVYEQQRAAALSRLDRFLGELSSYFSANTCFILVSPLPDEQTYGRGERLAPVLVKGPGIPRGSLLTSDSTRRVGLVLNTDVSATVLGLFDLSGTGLEGQAAEGELMPERMGYLFGERDRIVNTYVQRPGVLYPYVSYQVIVLILSLILLFLRAKTFFPWMRPLLLGNCIAPLALLVLPLFGASSLAETRLILVSLTVALALAFLSIRSDLLLMFVCLGGAVNLLLVGQLIINSWLLKHSFLSYDPIMGARFYGIGNEYMGVFVGTAILLAASAVQRFPQQRRLLLYLGTGWFVFLIFLLASPRYGANAGGTITAVIAFGITLYQLYGGQLKRRLPILAACLFLSALIGVIGLNLAGNSEAKASHIGHASRLLLSGHFSEIWEIITRKLGTNWRLVKFSPWSRVFVVSIIGMMLFFFHPLRYMQHFFAKYADLSRGFIGMFAGVVTALLFNDSGVLAAATFIIYMIVPFLLLMMVQPGDGRPPFRSYREVLHRWWENVVGKRGIGRET
jgi:hypothetical protein